jgi:ketosteroid isomerase-like protein
MSGREQQVRDTFAAIERGEFEAIEEMFAPDAKWRGPEPESDCLSRARILEVMRANRADGRLSGEIERVDELDDAHTLIAFRRAQRDEDGAMVDEDGLRWVVLTFGQDGLVAEMKGYADRASAVAYATS